MAPADHKAVGKSSVAAVVAADRARVVATAHLVAVDQAIAAADTAVVVTR